MKHILYLGLIFLFILPLEACGGSKQSAVEGKLMDWNDEPVAKVKIIASQVKPLKGYEQFETVTESDGSFRIEGLFPASKYELKPWSDKWTSETSVQVESAPQGETAVLPSTMVISMAYAKSGGGTILNLATGATRFSVSDNGVITDSQTGLDWLVGPDRNVDYSAAEQWVTSLGAVSGGNWRMPTRQELASLYQKGVGENNMDPAFRTTAYYVWTAEPHVASFEWGPSPKAWYFVVSNGGERWANTFLSTGFRVFGVRSQ